MTGTDATSRVKRQSVESVQNTSDAWPQRISIFLRGQWQKEGLVAIVECSKWLRTVPVVPYAGMPHTRGSELASI